MYIMHFINSALHGALQDQLLAFIMALGSKPSGFIDDLNLSDMFKHTGLHFNGVRRKKQS